MNKLDRRFEDAREAYTEYVKARYEKEASKRGYGFKLEHEPPDTLDGLRAAVGKSFPVWVGGSDHTIFTEKRVNYMFRYLHDHQHVDKGLDLTFRDECTLGVLWAYEVLDDTGDGDVARLALLDTVGQSVYHDTTGKFVEDQLAFAYQEFMKLENQNVWCNRGAVTVWCAD